MIDNPVLTLHERGPFPTKLRWNLTPAYRHFKERLAGTLGCTFVRSGNRISGTVRCP